MGKIDKDSPAGRRSLDQFLYDAEAAKEFRKSDEKRLERLRNNPDNGRTGWWLVSGIRHSAYAKASTAVEAVEKAIAADKVGDWEYPKAVFAWETPPDVF